MNHRVLCIMNHHFCLAIFVTSQLQRDNVFVVVWCGVHDNAFDYSIALRWSLSDHRWPPISTQHCMHVKWIRHICRRCLTPDISCWNSPTPPLHVALVIELLIGTVLEWASSECVRPAWIMIIGFASRRVKCCDFLITQVACCCLCRIVLQ